MGARKFLKIPFSRLRDRSIDEDKDPETECGSPNSVLAKEEGISQPKLAEGEIPKDASKHDNDSPWGEALNQLSVEDRATIYGDISIPVDINYLPEALLESVRRKRDICQSKGWSFKYGKHTINLKDLAGEVLEWLERFKQIGDIAVNADPVHAGLPWAGIRLLLQATLSNREQMQLLLQGLNRVTYLLLRCRLYEAFLLDKSPATVNLRLALVDMYILILSFLAKAMRIYQRSRANRALSAFWTTSDILEFERKCQDLENRADIETQNCERYLNSLERVKTTKALEYLSNIPKMESLQGLIGHVDDMWKTLQEQEAGKILRWISMLPHHDYHKAACQGRTPGTGEWLFEHHNYLSWYNSCDSKILWLHGIPGSGKTKLTSRVVDQWLKVQSENSAVAYFYCNYKEDSRRDAKAILQSLVKQMSKNPRGQYLHQTIVDIYRRSQGTGGGSAELNLEECQDLLCDLAQGYQQTTIILDALDESDQRLRGRLLKAFDRLIAVGQDVKVFISSRRDDDIKRRLGDGINIGLDATQNTEDISKFVRKEIEDGQNDRRRPIPEPLKQEIVAILGERSQGMFQWAALQIEQILSLELEHDIRLRLGRLPHDLKTAYDEIMEKIQSSAGSKPDIAVRAFQCVLFAHKHLSQETLVALLRNDPLSDEKNFSDLDMHFVLDACNNLLTVDTKTGICQFSHFSVQEYLLEHHYHLARPGGVEVFHADLAAMALKIILRTNKGHTPSEKSKVLPGMRYAAAFWYRHAKTALSACAHQGLQDLVDRLLSKQYTNAYNNWLRVWNPDSSMRVQGTTQFPSPLYYASLLGFQASVEKMLSNSVVISKEGRLGNALVASAVRRHWQITKMLLEKFQDVDLADLLLVMRRIKGDVDATLRVFLESGNLFGPTGSEERMKENRNLLMRYAASNTSCGDAVVAFLLQHGGEDISVTAGVVEAAAKNEKIAHKIFAHLLETHGSALPISTRALKAAAGNLYCGEEILLHLSEHGINFPVTEDVLNEAAKNERCGDKILPLLLTAWDSTTPIGERAVSNAARNRLKGDKLMASILSKWGMQAPITKDVLVSAAANSGVGDKIMKLLLETSDELILTEEVVIKAAGNWGVGHKVFAVLMKRLNQSLITEFVMKTAAGNWGVGDEIMSVLTENCDKLPVTLDVMRIAARNTECRERILSLLKDRY